MSSSGNSLEIIRLSIGSLPQLSSKVQNRYSICSSHSTSCGRDHESPVYAGWRPRPAPVFNAAMLSFVVSVSRQRIAFESVDVFDNLKSSSILYRAEVPNDVGYSCMMKYLRLRICSHDGNVFA